MPRANSKTTTATAKTKPKARKTAAHTTKTMELADRLNDIAGRLQVTIAAVFGIEALTDGDPAMGPLASMLGEISEQVRAVARDVHPSTGAAS